MEDVLRRLGSLEKDVSAIKADVALVRADVSDVKASIIQWMVSTMLAVAALAFTIAKFVH